jgi:ABC-type uncharacterized transport system ATPase subunit
VAVGFDTWNRRRGGGLECDDVERQPFPRRASGRALEMRHQRRLGGVHAVRDATIDLHQGEVMGLVGGNGAGHGPLIRTLSGASSGLGEI